MATPSFSLAAEDDLTCPVCFELLKDPYTPKLLDCPHVCCAMCIQKMIEGERKIVDCPECRHITRIPEDGVQAMKTNLRLRSLAEKHDEHMTKKSQSCPQHNISIDYYCKKCNIAGCSTCMVKNHKGPYHEFVDIQVALEEQNSQMDAFLKKAANNIGECKKTLKQLETQKAHLEQNLDVQQKTIEEQVTEALSKVQKEGQTLIESLKRSERRRSDRIENEMKRLQTQIRESENSLTTVKRTIETSEPHNLVTEHFELQHNVKKIFDDSQTGTEIDENPMVGMSKVVNVKAFIISGAFGRILQVRKVQCKLVNELRDFQGAAFITTTSSGQMVITDYKAKQVQIYSRQKNGQYKKQSSLSLSSKNTTANPGGVTTMADGKYLVARLTHVEVYSASGKYESVLDVKYDDEICARERGVNNVKMMPDDRVLVGDYKNSLLIILQGNITLRTIKTSMKPLRVTIMSKGRIALSNRVKGKIGVIDIESGRGLKTLDIPFAAALCYHETTDSLLVSRSLERTDGGYAKPGSGVLEQYCATTGGFVCRLNTELYSPQDMTFTSSGELVLADFKTVEVFKIQEE